MDEDGLLEALTQYKEQLSQIESVLESSGSHDELVQLKEDLEELIKTTEESLLCLKKSKLLQLVDNDDQSDSETQSQEDQAFDEEDSDAAGKTDAGKPMVMSDHFLLNGIKEIEDAIAGTQCQAPYSFEWGVKGYYNAMVLNVEKLNENCDELKVRVLFTNPTHRSMVPCPYFLDGKCRFDDDQCRYSHGCVVNISDLQEYTEPDFSVLKVDDKCLAKYDDGVWYKATILSITSDSINVHYDTYSIETCVPLEDVLPINDTEELSSDSDNENELNQEDDEEDVEAHVIAEFCPSHVDIHGALGNWEKHTRGIASKLMAKMGYVVGKGLGKNEDGRVEPVEIILLPTGKSLDACAELREKKKLKEPFKSKKKKKSSTQAPVQDVFEFINNKLGGRKGTLEDLKQNVQSKTLDRRKSGKHKSDTNYNIELFKLEQQKARIQKQIDKQKDSVSRNSTRDSTIAGQAMSKVVELQQKVKQLEDQEKWLKQKIHQNNEHKKLTVF